ncbi:MAG: flagellar filament capping protein FliD [Proteobacteria bacterium]|nr:flagellar filament capping protein FliD [Pseudomonadota bacterium]
MAEINFNSIKIDDSGRVAFSGLGSGIDFIGAVDTIIEARRIPIDRLETKIESNEDKIAAYQEFRAVLNGFQDSLRNIRGAATVGNSANIFSAKEAFASVSRTDGVTPSSAAALIGVTVTNAAVVGSHNFEILQTAAAHKISSDAFASLSATLGLTEGDQFTIEGTVITVSSGDSLLSLRDRINNANTGTTPTKVSASIVSVSTTEHYLVLTKDEAGSSITISDTTGTPLQTVGILDSGPAIKNELKAAQKAQFYADGLIDKTNEIYESARQSASTNTLGSSGTIHFDDGTTTLDLAYLTGDTIQGLADKINGDGTLTSMGISASVVTEGAQVRLKIQTTGDAFTMTETGGGTVLTDLDIGNARLLIERDTNSITDLFSGLTLSLFQAEIGTNIKIDIEQNLNAIKAELQSFVDAFNALKAFINAHSEIDETTGKIDEDAVLFGARTLSAIDGEIARIIGTGTQGVSGDFTVLAQIGIDFISNNALSDPLVADTLEIDHDKLDTVLLNNIEDVRRLFAFDFSSSDPRLVYLTSTGQTAYNASGYTLNVAYDDRFKSDSYVALGSFTQIDADTGGPAEDGISDIAFGDPVISGHAFRYSYDETTEVLTLRNLTLGTNETIDITTLLDAVVDPDGTDLLAGQTVAVSFSTLDVTITLSGDNTFARATKITDGTLDLAGIGPTNGGNMTGGTVSTPTGTMDKLTVDALIAAGVYDQATGLLTLPLESDGGIGGVTRMNTAAGIKFRLDGGSILSDISATDLDDTFTHTIEIYVTDTGPTDVLVATLTGYTFSGSTQDGTGTFTIDLGTGLIAETSSVISATSPMQNYLTDPALGNGSFDITDSVPTTLATISYNATDSLTDLAALIDADPDLDASVVSSGGTFYLQVTHANPNDNLIFTNDSDNLLVQLNMSDQNNVLLSANIDGAAGGADDGSVTVSGSVLTATDQTGVDGLKLLYTGTNDVDGVTLNYTVGIGAQLFHALDAMLNLTTGSVENEIDSLDDQNTKTQTRVNEMLARLEQQRQVLIDKFIAMETALIIMNRILDSIREGFDSLKAFQANRR